MKEGSARQCPLNYAAINCWVLFSISVQVSPNIADVLFLRTKTGISSTLDHNTEIFHGTISPYPAGLLTRHEQRKYLQRITRSIMVNTVGEAQ